MPAFAPADFAAGGAMAGQDKLSNEDVALAAVVAIAIAMIAFAITAHWMQEGDFVFAPAVAKGKFEFNQLTVAQFLGGVGGGVGAIIVGATLWLQLRALRELRRISQISHQFEAYSLWRALDESLDQSTLSAVANVLSALQAAIRDDVLMGKSREVEKIINERRYGEPRGDGSMTVTQTAKPAEIEIWNLLGGLRATVSAEYEAADVTLGKTTEVARLVKTYSMPDIAMILSGLESRGLTKLGAQPALLSGGELDDDDARRTRHLTNRFIMHLDEAETLDCAAQCVGLVSDPAVRQYLDILVRIRSDPAARRTLEAALQRDSEGRVDNLLVGAVIWDSCDVRSWQTRGAKAGQA